MPNLTALVTIASILVLFWASLRVGKARGTYKIKAPATTGDPNFERIFRAHQNMAEWMPIYLPALWLFAFYVGDKWAALVGLVWIVGRVIYVLTYAGAAEKRGPGFAIQASATGVLVVGSLIGIAKALIAG
ncbi:MAG: MAPEG family protein [Hyphomicrobiales bacterium]|nr:MAPEG family protein [Hyphomicrobiales bacterium]